MSSFQRFVYNMALLPIIFLIVVVSLQGYNSQELVCLDENQEDDIFSFTIEASSPRGPINLMYIQHDAKRLHPFTSTVVHDQMNMDQLVERTDQFRRHECQSIYENQTLCQITFKTTDEQKNISGGRTAFDRGHLTPVNPFRFSNDAMNHTFFCVNIAVQDPYTNQNPWFTVENNAHRYFNTSVGYVMTGLCDLDDIYSPTAEGYRIPACYWKLICYTDKQGSTQVVGFIGNNTLLNNNDSIGKAERTASTTYPRSQQDILNLTNRRKFVADAWQGAATYLLKNRNPSNFPPTGESCTAKLQISDDVRSEWSFLMKESLYSQEFTEPTDLSLVEKYWKQQQ